MTRRWRIDGEPTNVQFYGISSLLIGGGVVILPTDTIYGLHAVATNAEAVERIIELKGRADTKPLIVIASDVGQVVALGAILAEPIRRFLEEIWPAPLTVILPLSRPLPPTRGASTLAVRIPDLPWLRTLAERTGPLVSTSANRSGENPVTSPAELAVDLQDAVDGILDSGIRDGAPSALLDLTTAEPRFIREGERSFTQNVWKTLRKSL
ncbi:MAG: L-threonylcarbamoyladenylate synthase [Thermoanaerobaculia bacterium]